MGLCCSTDDEQQVEQFHFLQHQLHNNVQSNSPYGVGTGITMVMEQATALVKAPTGVNLLAMQAEIRKAKAEGRTVTIINGCIYFDYHLVGRFPPEIDFNA